MVLIPNLPPPPSRPRSKIDHVIDVQELMYPTLGTILEALRTLNMRMEMLMSQNDQLTSEVAANTAAVASLANQFTSLSAEISSEIADLAAAVAAQGTPNQAVTDAIAALQATNSQLASISGQASSLTSSLQSDNQP